MNFKIIMLSFMFSILLSCGVKSKPLSAPETAIQSYIDTYTQENSKEEIDNLKNKKN